MDSGEKGIDPVSMTIINPRKEYWPSRGSNKLSIPVRYQLGSHPLVDPEKDDLGKKPVNWKQYATNTCTHLSSLGILGTGPNYFPTRQPLL